MNRRPRTLKAQAVAWLAQREHSEQELRVKLLRWCSREVAMPGSADAVLPAGDADSSDRHDDDEAAAVTARTRRQDPGSPGAGADEVEQTLAWLRAQGYLDDARFVASRVHLRASRFGLGRIRQELSRLGVTLPAEAAAELGASEVERALAVWRRRFGRSPPSERDEARQARFLAARGFSSEVVRRVIKAARQGPETPIDGNDG